MATVNSIVRATDILITLKDGALMLTDIASTLNMSNSTTHRLLKTLRVLGFVAQDPITRKYCLGHLIVSLASGLIMAHDQLIICASDDIKHLRDLSGETVSLVIRVGGERMVLEELPSNQPIRFTLGMGAVAPIYVGSSGMVLLSELAKSDLEVLLKSVKLVPLTPNTITDKEALIKKVEETRKQGYATSFGTQVPAAAGLAVPIKGYLMPVAMCIYGPENRFANIMNCLKDLKESAGRISSKLREGTGAKKFSFFP